MRQLNFDKKQKLTVMERACNNRGNSKNKGKDYTKSLAERLETHSLSKSKKKRKYE